MKSLEISPCHLKLTDPLLTLEERRKIIITRMLDKTIPPIYIIGEGNEEETYFLFNGNKRTVLAKEQNLTLKARLITNQEDLEIAQKEDPRKFPESHPLEYEATREYLRRRAEYYAKMSFGICRRIISQDGRNCQSSCPIRSLYGY
jgi:hypothetical protein